MFTVGLKSEVASLVGEFALAVGAFAFNATRRERGARGEIVVGQRIGYSRISENRATVLASQRPPRHISNPLLAVSRAANNALLVFQCISMGGH
jgi:hypothetical protein